MRAVTILAAASAFAGSGLADSNAIAAEMRNIRGKVHALNSSIVAWPGDILSGGDLLCKTVDLHKAFLSCARAIKESSPMSQKEYSASIQRELLPFANDIFDLADSVEKVKIDFANKNTIRLTQYEVLRAQQVPAKEFAQKAVKTLFEKLPRNIRGGNIFGKPLGTYVSDSFAKGLDKTIETLKPEKGQYSAIAKAISLAANIENLHSTDMEPFCRAQPQLSQLFSGTQSVGLETLMQRTNEILKSSGLDGQVIPFDMLQKISGPLGIPAEKIAAAERKSQGMNLGGFANNALTIIKNLGVQDQLITASRTNQFINQLIRNLENQGPRQGQVKVAKAPLRSRRHAPGQYLDANSRSNGIRIWELTFVSKLRDTISTSLYAMQSCLLQPISPSATSRRKMLRSSSILRIRIPAPIASLPRTSQPRRSSSLYVELVIKEMLKQTSNSLKLTINPSECPAATRAR